MLKTLLAPTAAVAVLAATAWIFLSSPTPTSCGLLQLSRGLVGLPSMDCTLVQLLYENELSGAVPGLLARGTSDVAALRLLSPGEVDRMIHQNSLPLVSGRRLQDTLEALQGEVKQQATAELKQMVAGRFRGASIADLRRLLTHGGDVDAAMLHVANVDAPHMVATLMHHAAAAACDASHVTGEGTVPQAADTEHSSIAALLLEEHEEHETNPEMATEKLRDMIERGMMGVRAEEVAALLAGGADVNVKDELGMTALMKASVKGHVGVVEQLLLHHASVDLLDKRGLTALWIAEKKGHTAIAALLREHGATR